MQVRREAVLRYSKGKQPVWGRKLRQPVNHEQMRIAVNVLSETVPTADLDASTLWRDAIGAAPISC